MHHIKVNAIDSTNSYARNLIRRGGEIKPTCISAREQLKGRGQRGTSWNSKPGLNLTFSVLYPKPKVSPDHQFLISASVATAIINVIRTLNVPNLKLKWPNDIMSAKFKIGGILIENSISEGQMAACIVGVGINVNQVEFPDLPGASSMKLASGVHFSLDELLDRLVTPIEEALELVTDQKAGQILEAYKQQLFRKGIPSTFQLPDKSFFTGIIEDVNLYGKLLVRTNNDELQEFDLKEVKLMT